LTQSPASRLGTKNTELPGFLVLNPLIRVGGAQNYGNTFAPSRFQATRIGPEGQPIAKASLGQLRNTRWDETTRRRQLGLFSDRNRARPFHTANEGDLDGVVQPYELAFRMQGSLLKLLDLTKETDATRKLYGIGDPATDDFGRQCLLARRAVKSGSGSSR
jgi:hypothetical protein